MTALDRTDGQAADGEPPALVTPKQAAEVMLDDRLCLALYTASRSMTARYRVALEEFGLTYPQYLVMVLLWEEAEVSVGRIGERLSLESSTLSPLLKRLEGMGLVTRTRDRSDERLVIVSPTGRGRALREDAASVTLEICRASGLSMEAQSALVDELKTLDAELQDSTLQARSA